MRLKDKRDSPAKTRGDLPRISFSSKRRKKLHSFRLPMSGFAGRIHNKAEGKRVCGDSGASMHMVSRKDLNSAELETVRASKSPTTVVTANSEVPTKEEAVVYVRELDLFVTVMLLGDTPTILSLGKLCEDHGYNCHWTSKLFKLIFTYFSNIFIAGNRNSHGAASINKK